MRAREETGELFEGVPRRRTHNTMNTKSLAIAVSAVLSLAAFAPQAQARDRHCDDDRRDRHERYDRRHSDRDHHRSDDRYRSSREYHHDSNRRSDSRRHDHRSGRDVVLSLLFGR